VNSAATDTHTAKNSAPAQDFHKGRLTRYSLRVQRSQVGRVSSHLTLLFLHAVQGCGRGFAEVWLVDAAEDGSRATWSLDWLACATGDAKDMVALDRPGDECLQVFGNLKLEEGCMRLMMSREAIEPITRSAPGAGREKEVFGGTFRARERDNGELSLRPCE
jgi:hypothetical protein